MRWPLFFFFFFLFYSSSFSCDVVPISIGTSLTSPRLSAYILCLLIPSSCIVAMLSLLIFILNFSKSWLWVFPNTHIFLSQLLLFWKWCSTYPYLPQCSLQSHVPPEHTLHHITGVFICFSLSYACHPLLTQMGRMCLSGHDHLPLPVFPLPSQHSSSMYSYLCVYIGYVRSHINSTVVLIFLFHLLCHPFLSQTGITHLSGPPHLLSLTTVRLCQSFVAEGQTDRLKERRLTDRYKKNPWQILETASVIIQ